MGTVTSSQDPSQSTLHSAQRMSSHKKAGTVVTTSTHACGGRGKRTESPRPAWARLCLENKQNSLLFMLSFCVPKLRHVVTLNASVKCRILSWDYKGGPLAWCFLCVHTLASLFLWASLKLLSLYSEPTSLPWRLCQSLANLINASA